MAATETPLESLQFERLQVIGPISVVPVEHTTTPSWRIMLMGLTGTGKSTFIESFCSNDEDRKKLNISGGTLESVTEVIKSYKVVNVVDKLDHNRVIYLVDTPGFADAKISEQGIIKMAQDWLQSENLLGVNRIMYFAGVTDTRVSGSKKRCLEIFKAVAGEKAAEVVIFVSTMWDNCMNDRTRTNAESKFAELKRTHWKNYIDKGAHVVKFENSQQSSLAIMDRVCKIRVSGLKWFEFEEMQRHRKDIKNTIFGKLIYFSLLERRKMHITDLQNLDRDIQDGQINFAYRVFLRGKKLIPEAQLASVERDIKNFGEVNPEWEREYNNFVNPPPGQNPGQPVAASS